MRLVSATLLAGFLLSSVQPASAATCAQLTESLAPHVKEAVQLRRQILSGAGAGPQARCQKVRQLVEVLNGEIAVRRQAEKQHCVLPGPISLTVQGMIDRHKRELTSAPCR